MDAVLELSAGAQATQIAGGKLKAEALMVATLERIAAVNGPLNAIVSLRDADDLLAEARAGLGGASGTHVARAMQGALGARHGAVA